MPDADLNARDLRLRTWNRHLSARCRVSRPRDSAEVGALVAAGGDHGTIARGLGRSYSDAHLNEGGGVILSEGLDRMIDLDETDGTLTCEAGVTFDDILRCLLPRGWFLPVSPGTRHVTVGGAISNDVHGKNHHRDGSFGAHLIELTLLTASGELLRCTPDEHADVFWGVVGGLGLLGVILTARFRLMRVPSAWLKVDYTRTPDLDAALERFETADRDYRYSVAWIDGLAARGRLGRSVVMGGNPAEVVDLPVSRRSRPYDVPRRRRPSVPVNLPRFAFNPLTVRAFNTAYYRGHPDRSGVVVSCDPFFYPLDAVGHWYRLYGRRGFVQYQAAFPAGRSREALVELLETIVRSRRSSFLAVLKAFGPGNDGLLSFPMAGHTLALDMANTGDDLQPFIRGLDEITLRHGGRVYLAKDAFLAPEALGSMYPGLDAFRALKNRLDPERRFNSSLARRLGLVEAP